MSKIAGTNVTADIAGSQPCALPLSPGIEDLGDRVSFLGVEVTRGPGGPHVPNASQFENDVLTEYDLRLMQKVAVGIALNQALLIEGGAGIGKTTAVDRICAFTNRESYYANCHKLDSDQLIGKMTTDEDSKSGFGWKDGIVLQAIRNGGVLFLDEYNFMRGDVRGRLHEILDAVLNGKEEIILTENNGERVKVHPDFRIVVSQNPPGGEFSDREVLDPAQYSRFAVLKEPDSLPPEIARARMLGSFGLDNAITIPDSEYLNPGGGISFRELGQVDPEAVAQFADRYLEIIQAIKEMVVKRELGADQPQPVHIIEERDRKRFQQFVEHFYNGDLTDTAQQALRYYQRNRFSKEEDRNTVEELIQTLVYEGKRPSARRALSVQVKKGDEGPQYEPLTIADVRARPEIQKVVDRVAANSALMLEDQKLLEDYPRVARRCLAKLLKNPESMAPGGYERALGPMILACGVLIKAGYQQDLVKPLIAVLDHIDEVDDTFAQRALVAHTGHSDTEARRTRSRILDILKDTGDAIAPSLPQFLKRVVEPSSAEEQRPANEIVKQAGKAGIPYLIESLSASDSRIVWTAEHLLHEMAPLPPEVTDLLMVAAKSGTADTTVLARVMTAVAGFDTTTGFPLLKAPEDRVKEMGLVIVRVMDEIPAEHIPSVIALAKHANGAIALCALEVLGHAKAPETLDDVLATLVNAIHDNETRSHALDAVSQLGQAAEAAIPELVEAFHAQESWRSQIVESLKHMGEKGRKALTSLAVFAPEALEEDQVAELLRSWVDLGSLRDAVGKLSVSKIFVFEVLEKGAHQILAQATRESAVTLERALLLLTDLGIPPTTTRSNLLELAGHDNPKVRALAVSALGHMEEENRFRRNHFREAIVAAAADPDPEVKKAAEEALTRLDQSKGP